MPSEHAEPMFQTPARSPAARVVAQWGPPGLSGLVFCVLLFTVLYDPLVNGMLSVLRDSDSAWLIRTGQWILSHHAIPAHNPFGDPYPELSAIPIVCYQWLFEVMLGLAYNALGLHGVALLVAALFGFTYVLLVSWLERRGVQTVYAVLGAILISLPMIAPIAFARPMIVSLFMTAALMRLLDPPLSGRAAWLIYPLFFVLWANLHLGFLAGLAILGAFQAQRAIQARAWQPLGLWALCVVATLVNPYGRGLYAYFLRLADSPFMNANIIELQSHVLDDWMIGAYLALAGLATGFSFRDARIRPAERWLFFGGLLLAVQSARHIYLLGVISLPFFAVALDRWIEDRRVGKAERAHRVTADGGHGLRPLPTPRDEGEKPLLWITGALLAGLLLAAMKLYPVDFPKMAPIAGAIAYLDRHLPPKPILTDEGWGSYLIFASPARGYTDSRMDMYGDDTIRRIDIAQRLLKGWQSEFRERGIRYALYPADALQAGYLEQAQGWRVLYRDADSILLEAPGK